MPETVGASPLLLSLLSLAAFLDLEEGELMNPQAAGRVLMHVGLYMQRLSDPEIDALADELHAISQHAEQANWKPAQREFVDSFLQHCGFMPEEEADDPPRAKV